MLAQPVPTHSSPLAKPTHLGKGRGGQVVLHQRQEAVVQLLRRLVHAAVNLWARRGCRARSAWQGCYVAAHHHNIHVMQRRARQTQAKLANATEQLLAQPHPPAASQPARHTLTHRAGSSNGTGSNVRFTRQWSRLSLPCSTTSRGREVGGYTSNAASSSAPMPLHGPPAAGGHSAGRGPYTQQAGPTWMTK